MMNLNWPWLNNCVFDRFVLSRVTFICNKHMRKKEIKLAKKVQYFLCYFSSFKECNKNIFMEAHLKIN